MKAAALLLLCVLACGCSPKGVCEYENPTLMLCSDEMTKDTCSAKFGEGSTCAGLGYKCADGKCTKPK